VAKMQELERCFNCGTPTGRAGRADDSIYDALGNGPYCPDCWHTLGDGVLDDRGLAEPAPYGEGNEPKADDYVMVSVTKVRGIVTAMWGDNIFVTITDSVGRTYKTRQLTLLYRPPSGGKP